jgi:hypothetical protein
VKRGTSLVGLLGWSIGAAALGLAAGLIVNETLGEVGPARIKGLVRKRRHPAPARTGQLARLVRQALRADPALAHLTLDALPVSAGIVELHGWVSTRAERTRAARLARVVPGLESLINCILVHGEDDFNSPEDSTASA